MNDTAEQVLRDDLRQMLDHFIARGIVGASLAVSGATKAPLLLAAGLADRASGAPVVPDRLFKIEMHPASRWMLVHPVGDGVNVSMDAIGTRVAATVSDGTKTWTVRGTLSGGSCFSAQNGFDVFLGLRGATQVLSLQVIWPDRREDADRTRSCLQLVFVRTSWRCRTESNDRA